MRGRPKTLAAICLVLLIALSGCSAITGDETNSTTTTSSAETATTTDATTTTETTGPVHNLPLSEDELVNAHAAALREAGNFTYVGRTHIRNPESGKEVWRNTTVTGDVDTSEIRRQQNSSAGSDSQIYRPGSGEPGYYRTSKWGSGWRYLRSSKFVNMSEYVEPDVKWFVRDKEVTYEGVETVSGTEVHVYAVPNKSAFTGEKILGSDRENVSAVSIRYYVTDDGLLKRHEIHFEARRDGTPVTIDMWTEYRDVGATTVEPPSWLSEAKDEVNERTNPSEIVTKTVRDERLGVAVTMKGPRYAMERLEVERKTGANWDGGFRKAQVSPLVVVRPPNDADVESAVSGDEDGVAVYQYNRTIQTFVRLETDVDTDANVASADFAGRGVYLVMHEDTWNSLWE